VDEGKAAETTTTEPDNRGRSLFPIVGVGASAGGLAATAELLRHLGATPGVAVVVVHHLDPTHESSLVEIFSRATPLPVHGASDDMPVEPNHVYVVPPNADLLLVDGLLKVTPRLVTNGRHLPIDRFFESLATDRTVYAVGVVLTGTGSDGTQGIKAIKAEGGITLVQDGSAEHRSMPDSAIATGCVDFVLPPEGIARELVRIGEHAPPLAAAVDETRAEADFQRIVLALRKATEVDFANYKQTTVRRRVQRRVLVRGLPSLGAYAELLDGSPEEAAALYEDVLIHVTSFFRDPETFDFLETSVFPKLLENRPRDACIRVWVPGCSTGEEVYSFAISLLEFLADADANEIPLKLFGTDLSLNAIEKARAGRYPTSIERDVSQERLQRFFSKLEDAYQIRKDVRNLCVFAKHDATRDPPFSGMDLVSCRNLMIYLGPALQDRILPTFHYALKEPGFLVLGTSETTRAFPGFSTLDAKNKIYRRTSAAPRLLFDFNDPRLPEPTPQSTLTTTKPSGPLDVHREADRLILAEFAPPGVVVTNDLAIVQFRGKTGPFLEPSPGVASFDLLRMVREELRLPLRQTIDEARSKRRSARKAGVYLGSGPTARAIEIEVIPFGVASTTQRFFVVLFKEPALAPDVAIEDATPTHVLPPPTVESQLAQELASTRDYLQSIIEQLEVSNEELRAANEETVSSNEELRSTNEELRMAKDELEATNEELHTVNEQMTARNLETARLNDDLTNVLSSVEIPIVILGRDSRLRRFTPAAAKLLHLTGSDLGRPITELKPIVPAADLSQTIADVLEHLSAVSHPAQAVQGHWYQLAVRPYLTADNRIDGTVITIFDIDALKKGEQLIAEAREYAESIVDTVRESLVVLDQQLRVRSANRAFCETFGGTQKEIEGRHLYALGRGEWNIPGLRTRLEALTEGDKLEGFRVEQDPKGARSRTFLLNARRIEQTPLILLAFEDVTERVRAEKAFHRTEMGFRELLSTATEAILMTDPAGTIVFANQAATQIFGFSADELIGLSVDTLVPERLRGAHAKHRASYMAHFSTRPMGRTRNLVGRKKDGTEFPIDVVLGAMERESGPLVVSFITDTTGRRESESKLREYQDKLQRMAFDAAVAEERERRRIAADLHDHIGQSLALAQIKLTSTRDAVTGAPRTAIDEAVELLAQSAIDTRTLTFELSPPVLYDLGLKAALSWLVEDVEKRHGIRIELHDDEVDKPLDEATAALVFRAVRELLLNVFKHAKAPSAKVSLRRTGDHFDIDVEDAGVGFDPEDVALQSAAGGFGLFSVREQIGRLGGTLSVASAPHQGTRVSMRVPLKIGDPQKTEVAEKTP
jgi:two-component system CheB/CheR fusion protein